MAALLVALLVLMGIIIIMKLMICSCYMGLQRRRRDDRTPILNEDDLSERLAEIHRTRMRARRAREPPPTFDDAIRNSRPVSYIDIEQPPPTYEDYLKTSSQEDIYLDSSSANPTDIAIGLDTLSVTSIVIESNA
ncbi:unnamed protein product [Orchesella dallaii]|uniref:Uncharacterized protein n=1 Tax=Orchesella dallaii TaxID=48710 RepID=A0ABP1RE17_9HEXA